ncbi:hypothetical protein [uncultured Mailhella sp.]|uniref:hypothetical protein n=1 Tax=uncultured Mailhella sp. TaxID=1981031 RepID=UPI0025EC055C|nr:hypothetical protein [uncultured Mailhella sp.]
MSAFSAAGRARLQAWKRAFREKRRNMGVIPFFNRSGRGRRADMPGCHGVSTMKICRNSTARKTCDREAFDRREETLIDVTYTTIQNYTSLWILSKARFFVCGVCLFWKKD